MQAAILKIISVLNCENETKLIFTDIIVDMEIS